MPTPGDPPAAVTPDALRILSALLGAPERGACQAIEELGERYPWLQDPAGELLRTPLAEWQAEHTRLFVSGYPHALCPPYESAYRHGCMDGPACTELARLYRRAGLQAVDMPPDYLGVMLDGAAHLLDPRKAPRLELWQELWDQHLGRWVPQFARDLQTHARLALYRGLGAQLHGLFRPRPQRAPRRPLATGRRVRHLGAA